MNSLDVNYVYEGNFEEYMDKYVTVTYRSKENPHDIVDFQGNVVDTYDNGVQGNQGLIIEGDNNEFKHIKARRLVEEPQVLN